MAQRPEDRDQAWVLQSQIERMSQQISYQLQRASLRKSGLVRHQVRLQPVLQSLCDTLDKVYRDKRVTVVFDLPRVRCADREGRLAGMLGNLLENAYRLCLSKVRISLESLEGIELCIEDDGPGVPPTSARGFCSAASGWTVSIRGRASVWRWSRTSSKATARA
jgi:two-component system sensor histidine kinase PhoQ